MKQLSTCTTNDIIWSCPEWLNVVDAITEFVYIEVGIKTWLGLEYRQRFELLEVVSSDSYSVVRTLFNYIVWIQQQWLSHSSTIARSIIKCSKEEQRSVELWGRWVWKGHSVQAGSTACRKWGWLSWTRRECLHESNNVKTGERYFERWVSMIIYRDSVGFKVGIHV